MRPSEVKRASDLLQRHGELRKVYEHLSVRDITGIEFEGEYRLATNHRTIFSTLIFTPALSETLQGAFCVFLANEIAAVRKELKDLGVDLEK